MSNYKRVLKMRSGYSYIHPKTGRRIRVKPHKQHYYVKRYKPVHLKKTFNMQQKELDWSHLSTDYPNIMGLTDEEIENFIDETTLDEEYVKEYLNHIKCYNRDDLKELSKKAYADFDIKVSDIAKASGINNSYGKGSTIYVTSPRGGFEILSDFAYANQLEKANVPYDLEKDEWNERDVLRAESLPYGYAISDVNDIVFVDDIYMSGEQCEKAIGVLKRQIENYEIDPEEIPRFHYIALVGNKDNKYLDHHKSEWDTFTIADEHSFERISEEQTKKYENIPKEEWFKGVSAVVFPFSVPDGNRHFIARDLYRRAPKRDRFKHREY